MTPHQMSIDDLTEGERLRDEGMAATEAADLALNDGADIAAIDSWIQMLSEDRETWSANDLRRELPGVRQPLIGARIRAAAMRRQIVKVGYEPSTLPSTHSHPIARWRGVSS